MSIMVVVMVVIVVMAVTILLGGRLVYFSQSYYTFAFSLVFISFITEEEITVWPSVSVICKMSIIIPGGVLKITD